MMKDASKAFAVDPLPQKKTALKKFCDTWQYLEPEAIRKFEKGLEKCLEAQLLPKSIRSKATTTGRCENLFGYLRKRLNKIGAFESPRATELFVLAIAIQKNELTILGIPKNTPLIKSTHSY